MEDMEMVFKHVRAAKRDGKEISDACVRVVASLHHNGGTASYGLASTGTVPKDISELWVELFGPSHEVYQEADNNTRDMFDAMSSYLRAHAGRGPVSGWSRLWL